MPAHPSLVKYQESLALKVATDRIKAYLIHLRMQSGVDLESKDKEMHLYALDARLFSQPTAAIPGGTLFKQICGIPILSPHHGAAIQRNNTAQRHPNPTNRRFPTRTMNDAFSAIIDKLRSGVGRSEVRGFGSSLQQQSTALRAWSREGYFSDEDKMSASRSDIAKLRFHENDAQRMKQPLNIYEEMGNQVTDEIVQGTWPMDPPEEGVTQVAMADPGPVMGLGLS
ncbi:uncharacterized protein BYT42DRAFT_612098 [Radiomyces spectabilis]|uniref:uncharacterized protein n=1 Tax=Radiomyces spectabilis TaxID=64574 RepID=UPI0022211F70|nr:uncharacterized protein BYT42DRAFT_612098 [Radiomyces spectabilis]KAI8384393.1 hypothetical protein BYT42DRAFT_612098 [Radiomyces spectabilis]